MPLPTIPSCGSRRRAFSRRDLFWLVFALAVLIFIAVPALRRGRERLRRETCALNLRAIVQGCTLYANDNDNWFPHHYYEVAKDTSGPLPDHGVTWVGMMGSSKDLRISEITTPVFSPHASHPSRSLFMLIRDGTCITPQFCCPSSSDTDDDLQNRGPDKTPPRSEPTERRMSDFPRYDFRGYSYLSYGYQLPYGPLSRPSVNLDARMVVLADKGPYYEAGGEGLPGSETVRDQLSSATPPRSGSVTGWSDGQWRPYNSRLHWGAGQNVAYVDGHFTFEKKPCVGINFDNIYTIQRNHALADVMMGKVPDAHETIGPFTNTDSFIVP